MNERILIIEDEESILMGLEDDLVTEGYQVDTATNGDEGYQKALDPGIDLILLDIMLPGKDGFTICRELRNNNVHTPIIMLTAKSQEVDKVLGLEFGADDYVTKPFSLRELQARIRANLRRRQGPSPKQENMLTIGMLQLDIARQEARLGDDQLELTQLEFEILHYLAAREGKTVNRYDMLDEVWGEDVRVSSRTIDTHVANLRKKMERELTSHAWIRSVRGVGYKLVAPPDNS